MAISRGLAQRLDGISRLAGRIGVMLYRGFHRMLLLLFMTADRSRTRDRMSGSFRGEKLPKATVARRFV
jgi:hypothetical protein